MNDFHIAHPAIIATLLVTLPLCALFWRIAFQSAWKARDAYGERRLLMRFADNLSFRKQVVRLVLSLGTILFLTLSASGPVWKAMPDHVKAGSLQAVVIFTVDPGMAAEDYRGEIPEPQAGLPGQQGNRLQEALYQVQHGLMPAISGNQLGFVTYMGGAFAQAHLTDDFSPLDFIIDNGWIKAGLSADGTDLGDATCCGDEVAVALDKALEVLQESNNPSTDRVIVYFGDGGFTSSWEDIQAAMTKLNEAHVRLVVVGTGNQSLVVPVYQDNGVFIGNAKFDGKTGVSGYFEQNLQRLAEMSSSGEYVHIEKGDQRINWPSAVSNGDKSKMVDNDIYYVPLSIAMILMIILAFPLLIGANPGRLRGGKA